MLSQCNPKFGEEITSRPGGENIRRCFTCGACTVSCPITEIDNRFSPRKIIHMVLLGMKGEVLFSDLIWMCSGCYLCYDACPQDVRFTSIIRTLRAMAVREMSEGRGRVSDPGLLFANSFLDSVKSFGKVWELGMMLKFFIKKKDLRGALAYAPLGIKMLGMRKVPLLPSRDGEGTKRMFKKVEEQTKE